MESKWTPEWVKLQFQERYKVKCISLIHYIESQNQEMEKGSETEQ